MSLSRSIAKNTVIQVAGKLLGTVLALIAAGLILRYLSETDFGKYTTIMAFLQMFGIFMDFGLYIVLIKRISGLQIPEDGSVATSEDANTIFSLRVLSGIVVLSIAPIAAWIIGQYEPNYDSTVVTGIALTTFFFFFISLNQLLSAIFQKFLATRWIAIGEFTGKLAQLAATVTVIALGGSVVWIMATLVIGAGINFLVNLIAAQRFIRLRITFPWERIKDIMSEAWPIALSIFFTLMYFKGDTLILTFFETEAVVAWYGAPYKILEVLITFPAMFAGLALPVLTAAWESKDANRFGALLQKSFDALVIFSIPMIAGTWVLGEDIMQLIAGDLPSRGYENSIGILNILIIATALIYLGTLFGYLVVSLGKQRTMLFGYAFVGITALAGYLTMVPRFSTTGAAWVTVYSEAAVLLITLWIVLRTSRAKLRIWSAAASVLASAGMFLVLRLAHTWAAGLNNLSPTMDALATLGIFVPLGALVYAVLLLGLRGVRIADMKELLRFR